MSDRVQELVGQLIENRYRVKKILGQGGMGTVYEVEHVQLGRRLALKTLHGEFARDREVVARFHREARAAAAIGDEHIIGVTDVGQLPNGEPYIILEFLEGTDLGDLLEKTGPMSPAETVQIAAQCCRALGKAHDKGIVHRDIKPDNIFLVDRDGAHFVKLLDFGISKLVDAAIATDATKLTKTGAALGTPYYMSPEQINGETTVDARSDIWAMGVVVYQMLSGQVPFAAPTYPRLVVKVLYEEPLEMPAHLDLPAPLIAAVSRAMAKEPADRHASIVEFAQALEAALAGQGVDAHATTQPAHPADPQAAAAVVRANTPMSAERDVEPVQLPTRNNGPLIAGAGAAALAIGAWLLWPAAEPPPERVLEPAAAAAATPASEEPAKIDEPSGSSMAWARIEPPQGPPVILGVPATASESDTMTGFRPERKVRAPGVAFDIHTHEVTWEALDAWLEENPEHAFQRPTHVTDERATRATLPATGMPWKVAQAYCQALGGSLPTEAQWEYAARGAELRPYPWGSGPPDLSRMRAFAGEQGTLAPVATSEQDRTPGAGSGVLHDMMGNAQELTLDIWSDPSTGAPPQWSSADPTRTYRAVRGYPLSQAPPPTLPVEGAAYRSPLCADGSCVERFMEARAFTGFRCVRPATDDEAG